ncbi:MAG: HAMP domain-containing sensor histidine kinase [Pseudomonadota bacterium]
MADRIRLSVTRLTGLMETFLLSSRAESGALDFNPAAFDVKGVLEELCDMHDKVSPSHTCRARLGDAPQHFLGDERLVRQAVSNLISNAIKYSRDADAIEVTCFVTGDDLVISVRDWGIGIPADEVDRLGSQFFRASNHGGIMGTGVGLHLVTAVAQEHGGALSVDSEVGEGSVFTLTLPLSQPMESARDDAGEDAGEDAERSEEVAA